MKRKSLLLVFFLFLLPVSLLSLTVDLQDPILEGGVLQTTKGGVISGEGFRFQAQKMLYQNTRSGHFVEAEGDLQIEYGPHLLVGNRLVFDFTTECGTLYQGITEIKPWLIQADCVTLTPEKSLVIYGGTASISSNPDTSWRFFVKRASLTPKGLFNAENVRFSFIRLPLFWVPSMGINLRRIFNSPFRYIVRWGGDEGLRFGVITQIGAHEDLDVQLRTDYRTKYGFGGGIDVHWDSSRHQEHFQSTSYIAQDKFRLDQKKKTRYRHIGEYTREFDRGSTSVHFTYDKLSDKEMATDFSDRGLKLIPANRTQFTVRREEETCIVNGVVRTRINRFQTVKKELPTLAVNCKPIPIGSTGIVSHNTLKFSYLELEYADALDQPTDYNSTRCEAHSTFYTSLHLGHLVCIPEVEHIGIYYGNNPDRFDRWTTVGRFGGDLFVDFSRTTPTSKHVVTPYLRGCYTTSPSTSPDDHFVFDLSDGLAKTSLLRMGMRHQFFQKDPHVFYRVLEADFYTYAFFSAKRFSRTFPRQFLSVNLWLSPKLKGTLHGGWDFERGKIDHLNYRVEYTHNRNFAFSTEYRHRSPHRLRKVDQDNFMLDFFRSEKSLLSSSLSDKRDTFLCKGLYRFRPDWAIEVEARRGWGRDDRTSQPNFFEYQVNLLTQFRSSAKIKLSYRHRENENRFTVHYSFGFIKPEPEMLSHPTLPFEY